LLVSDSGTLIGACEAVLGIAQDPRTGCKHLLDNGRLVELFSGMVGRALSPLAIYPSRFTRSESAVFIEFCMEVMPESDAATFEPVV